MFKTDLVIKRNPKEDDSWFLVEPLVWNSNAHSIYVPKGFETNFASVPQLVQNIIPSSGQESDRAAVLHDWMYGTQMFDRDVCDAIFLEAMKVEGVSYMKRYAMYYAVRAFGSSAYAKGKRQ
jgi:hypothetical protein